MQFSLWLQISLTAIPLRCGFTVANQNLCLPCSTGSTLFTLRSPNHSQLRVRENSFVQHCYRRHYIKGHKGNAIKATIKNFETFHRLYEEKNKIETVIRNSMK